jgi:hypothetical protein
MFVTCARRQPADEPFPGPSSEHNGGKPPKRVIYDYMNRRLKVRPFLSLSGHLATA